MINRLMIHNPEMLTLKNMYLRHWQLGRQRQTSEVKHSDNTFVPLHGLFWIKKIIIRSGMNVIKI